MVDEAGKAADSTVHAGVTFFGQFIDHDITLDVSTSLDRPVFAGDVENSRTSNLDLDCVYGNGPDASPFLYDLPKLVVGDTLGQPNRYDLARFNGVALIGDSRNDENAIVSQLQAAFIAFHNAVVDAIVESSGGTIAELSPAQKRATFETARDHVIHYYHRLIAEDFLPNIIGVARTLEITTKGRKFYFKDGFFNPAANRVRRPYIPIEFSVAAYRFGHSQVRETYDLNQNRKNIPLFDLDDPMGLMGFKPIDPANVIDWRFFFPVDGSPQKAQRARKIDTKLPSHLFELNRVNVVPADDLGSLAARNLNRGRIYRLPSGQALAQVMGFDALAADGAVRHTLALRLTPLWYYILQEAKQQPVQKKYNMVVKTKLVKTSNYIKSSYKKGAGDSDGGDILGPVGGTIVGEVLIGLIDHYRESTGKGLDFIPSVEIGTTDAGEYGLRFQMQNLLRFTGLLQ